MLRLLLSVAMACLLSLGQAGAQDAVFTIGSTDSPPLSLPDQSGMLDRMLKEAFARAGARVEFLVLPSERSLVQADTGRIDGDNNRVAGLQSRYPHLVQVPESNMTYEFMAFAAKPGVAVKAWSDLDAFNVAYIIGWKVFEDNVKAPRVSKVANATQLFSLLKFGRVDVVLIDRIGGYHYLRELGVGQGYAVEPPLAKRDMYLYLNERHAAMAQSLAKSLRTMKADGSHARFFSLSGKGG